MTIRDYVLFALQRYPITRSDDDEMVRQVFRAYAADNGLSVDVAEVVARSLVKFPKVRTIVRERANLQKKYPHLANPATLAKREQLEEEYREEYSPKN